MIGVKKNIIIVNMGFIDVVMFNPVIVSKHDMYETEEGCLSLDGVRKTTRYQEIEVEYYDFKWKKQRQKLSGWTPVPNDGGSALKTALSSYISESLKETQVRDIENERVKQ